MENVMADQVFEVIRTLLSDLYLMAVAVASEEGQHIRSTNFYLSEKKPKV
jgi:hypothetical protein